VLTFEIISKVSATVIFCVDNFSEIVATVIWPWLFSVVKYSHEVAENNRLFSENNQKITENNHFL